MSLHLIKISCIFLTASSAQCPSNVNQDHNHGHIVPQKFSQDYGNSATK